MRTAGPPPPFKKIDPHPLKSAGYVFLKAEGKGGLPKGGGADATPGGVAQICELTRGADEDFCPDVQFFVFGLLNIRAPEVIRTPPKKKKNSGQSLKYLKYFKIDADFIQKLAKIA